VRALDRADLELEQKEGTITERGAKADTVRDVAQGAVIGASAGYETMGRGKDTAIGAAVGAGAVLVGKKINAPKDGAFIPFGTQLTLTLNRPLEVPDNAAPRN
jgi:hypothetical protein